MRTKLRAIRNILMGRGVAYRLILGPGGIDVARGDQTLICENTVIGR